MRISLLDRIRTHEGESDADALSWSIERARRAEQLGFHRYWVAEHHGVPGVVGGAPLLMLAALGAHTTRIRLGSGGVMLPNHAPLVVAEQALMLESLYPGRIDLGLGSSLGYTAPVRRALGRTDLAEGEYRQLVQQVLDHFSGAADVTARPQVSSPPPVFQLATGDGLQLAAELGLPAVVGGPLLKQPQRLREYTERFRPGPHGAAPQLILFAEVVVADSAEQARRLLLSEAWALADSRDVGEFRALRPVEDVEALLEGPVTPRKRDSITRTLDSAVSGTAEQVGEQLSRMAQAAGADEVMAWTSIWNREQLAASDRGLAEAVAALR
ncbi:MsnO8 family LLM class oxidoreductase [Nesterenkonia aerolata]|uniref:MsnO8 family LLM class oxidoreductase n=1 Tax=Nesterenkonia aerolata TaxID=3074079 RepID=A0ABU2DPA6_9MICC|nr:MsnO8 family LLM class oxidoreductase [Nesterenkonia sp. LY-0111]MDR8018342.1 MsnO8 family LLM class oxidoreductase [Nesterenkonia sp. LY-0111]